LAGIAYQFFLWSPKPKWNKSSDAIIITIERPLAELDYNYIPEFRVWGDGYIVWVEQLPNGNRRVMEGYLPQDKMEQLIIRFIKADFFKRYRILYKKAYALPMISIYLLEGSASELIDPEQKRIYDLVDYVRSGAGTTGREYVPTVGTLIAIPVEETEFRKNPEPKYTWPDERFGDLGTKLKDEEPIILSGEELKFAWGVVNSPRPLVQSKGKTYWIAVIVPKISQ
jgi:hypothetical protein